MRRMWCIQTVDAIFRACMYDFLDRYEEPYDPKRPLVNLDEKPKQLLGDKRVPISMKPGSPEKYDYEYPDVEVIRRVTDNLNIHKEKAFYETFSKDEAEKILSKIEFHYTPKHASWLNAAEIEINVMDIECTGRWIGNLKTLAREVAAWTKRRNNQKKKINSKFTREKADKKQSTYYVP